MNEFLFKIKIPDTCVIIIILNSNQTDWTLSPECCVKQRNRVLSFQISNQGHLLEIFSANLVDIKM